MNPIRSTEKLADLCFKVELPYVRQCFSPGNVYWEKMTCVIKELLRSSVVSGGCCEMQQQERSEAVRGWSSSRMYCNTAK